jgi:hypothetical protein
MQKVKAKQNSGYPAYLIPGGGSKWRPLIIRNPSSSSEKQDHPLAARAEALFAWANNRKLAASNQNDQKKSAMISPTQKQNLEPRAVRQDGLGGFSQVCVLCVYMQL